MCQGKRRRKHILLQYLNYIEQIKALNVNISNLFYGYSVAEGEIKADNEDTGNQDSAQKITPAEAPAESATESTAVGATETFMDTAATEVKQEDGEIAPVEGKFSKRL